MTSTVLLIGLRTRPLASLVERLARRGHRIMLAWNSRDGARMAHEAKPDLVVVDRPEGRHNKAEPLYGVRNVLHVDGNQRPGRVTALVERALDG